MTTIDLDAIRARYDRAIEAKPSKGDYTADDFAEHYGHLPVMMANTVQILANYLTGDERSWDAEEADLDLSWTIESVQQHGIVNPITLGTDGRVLDGHHRLLAARKLGISQVPVRLAIMPTEPAPSPPPTVEQITEVIEAELKARTFPPDITGQGGVGLSPRQLAEAVHKLYPTCQPSREQIEEAIRCEADACGVYLSRDFVGCLASSVLALLPGRSEAEVKAEALREFADWMEAGDNTVARDALNPYDLIQKFVKEARRIAGGEGRG